jgi:DNA (cytosine-5)-methyltransferase 1
VSHTGQGSPAPRPRALDLFCGAGGAAMGLHRAGFDVVGVDIKPQPRYPFPFIRGDALKPPVRLADFDLVWASPPCQHASSAAHRMRQLGKVYPNLIEPTRRMLDGCGRPYVIENVPQAAVRPDIALEGPMFGLRLLRRRHFELSGFFALALSRLRPHPDGVVCVVGHGRPSGMRRGPRRPTNSAAECRAAMGIDWMSRDELTQAIPPAYSEWIGRYALIALGRVAA